MKVAFLKADIKKRVSSPLLNEKVASSTVSNEEVANWTVLINTFE